MTTVAPIHDISIISMELQLYRSPSAVDSPYSSLDLSQLMDEDSSVTSEVEQTHRYDWEKSMNLCRKSLMEDEIDPVVEEHMSLY